MNDTNTIKTIFYYPKSLEFEDYQRLRANGTIAPRTIVFAEAQKAIYKDGVQYGSANIDDLKNLIEQIFVENPYTLPVATAFGTISKYHIGGVMAGDFLKVDSGGKLDFNDAAFRVYIQETPEWVDTLTRIVLAGIDGKDGKDGINAVIKKASKDDWGIVKIGAGLSVSDGVISVDATQGQNGQNGRGITSIDLYGTVGLVDTYQITYTDGTHSYFTVTNGASGQNGQGGQDGQDGQGGGQQVPQTILNQLNALNNALDTLNDTTNQEYTRLDGLISTLDGKVDQVLSGNIDGTVFQNIFNQYVEDGIAGLDIANLYASKNAEGVIEWLYSGLTGQTSNYTSFADIVSAGRSGLHTAIADVHTYVEKLANGDYVASSSMEAKVDEALAGLKVSAGSNTAKTEIFNKINKNSSDISGILSEIAPGEASVSIATRIGNWKSGLVTTSNIDSAISTMMASNSNNSIAAAILVAVNNGGSTATITADRIDINGLVTALNANQAFISTLRATKVNIAKSVVIGEGSENQGIIIDSFGGNGAMIEMGTVNNNGTMTSGNETVKISGHSANSQTYPKGSIWLYSKDSTDRCDEMHISPDGINFKNRSVNAFNSGDDWYSLIVGPGGICVYRDYDYNSTSFARMGSTQQGGLDIYIEDKTSGAYTRITPGLIVLYDGTNTKTITASN